MHALPIPELKLLLLIIVANGAPLLGSAIFRHRFDLPVDGGLQLADGRRLIGSHTTLRGILLALLATAGIAPLLGLPWPHGLLIGGMAMLGDILSSFVKRRLDLAPGDRATGLDQLPESLLPLWAVAGFYGLSWLEILLGGLLFMLFDMAASRLLHPLGLRERPH